MMTSSTKAFLDAWYASIDLNALILGHYQRELGVQDLSEVQMISEIELIGRAGAGPRCAIGANGMLLYDAGVTFLYRFKPVKTPPLMLKERWT
jgi:hypothetical protein